MLNSTNKPKLCYILPDYRPKSHTHFAHLVDFVGEISKFFDTLLIIEKGERPKIDLGCQRVQVLWFQFSPLRWCELHCRLFYARLLGYRNFYIHYSFLSAFLSSLITRLVGGRTFYWNCGQPWKYRRNFLREGLERLIYKMTSFLVTGTEGLKYQYAQHYNLPLEKIKVMPNWINLESVKRQVSSVKKDELIKKLNIFSGQKILLFVHRLSKRKGAHYLPEILKKLSDPKNPNTSELSETNTKEIVEKDLSYKLGGIFFEIQNELGRFCRERQYADALEQKLKQIGLEYKRESSMEVGGRKSNFADFIVENKILIEIKAKPFILKDDYYQTLRYLETFNLELGLLVNFRSRYLKPKRVLNYKMYYSDHSNENLDSSNRRPLQYSEHSDGDLDSSNRILLLIVGDGPERDEIESRIKNYELSNRVRFLDWLPNEELPSYYSIADVFIMPSEEEGFPHVLLEAMAAGTPFVSFDVGGVKEITPSELHYYITNVGDIDSFIAKVKEVLKMAPEGRVKIGELEKKWVEKYDIKKVARFFPSIII